MGTPIAVGPADVTPNYDLPIINTLTDLAGGVQGAVLLVIVILLVCAVVAWGAGKAFNSSGVQKVGIGAIIVCIAGAAIVGSAGGFVDWGSQLQLLN